MLPPLGTGLLVIVSSVEISTNETASCAVERLVDVLCSGDKAGSSLSNKIIADSLKRVDIDILYTCSGWLDKAMMEQEMFGGNVKN